MRTLRRKSRRLPSLAGNSSRGGGEMRVSPETAIAADQYLIGSLSGKELV